MDWIHFLPPQNSKHNPPSHYDNIKKKPFYRFFKNCFERKPQENRTYIGFHSFCRELQIWAQVLPENSCKFSWLDTNCKDTHLSIYGPTVDSARQSTNQAWSQRNCLQTSEAELSQGTDLGKGTEARGVRWKPLLSKRHMAALPEVCQKAPKGLSACETKNSLVWWDKGWTLCRQCQTAMFGGNQAGQYHPYSDAQWWQNHAAGM